MGASGSAASTLLSLGSACLVFLALQLRCLILELKRHSDLRRQPANSGDFPWVLVGGKKMLSSELVSGKWRAEQDPSPKMRRHETRAGHFVFCCISLFFCLKLRVDRGRIMMFCSRLVAKDEWKVVSELPDRDAQAEEKNNVMRKRSQWKKGCRWKTGDANELVTLGCAVIEITMNATQFVWIAQCL